ncbi:MAG: DUF2889 domain-containing protein [Candidatus Thiodiazotropha sp.]|jgi:hypothetical protein
MSETKAPKALHHRSINHQTWRHEDGALEIESRLIDTKEYDTQIGFNRPLSAGEPVHDMTIRILLGPDGVIRGISLRMDSTPFDICPEVIGRFEDLRGASMGKGWNNFLSMRFGGAGGCRHLIDLLRGMGTVVFQSAYSKDWTPDSLERMAGSCYAFRQGGSVMVRLSAEVAKKQSKDDQ